MAQRFRFSDIYLDTDEETLMRGEERLALNYRAFQMLKLLVERSGSVVTKQEFFDTIWADTFVEENNLTVAVTTLRKVLGDDARNPKFIETIPRKGYRFIAEVTSVEDEPADQFSAVAELVYASPDRSEIMRVKSRAQPYVLVGAACLLLAAILVFVAGFGFFERGSATASGNDGFVSIAVLPFRNSASDSEYLADGLTEGVADSLAELPNLRVISRNSTFNYKDTHLDPATVGRELNVGVVLTGQIEYRGNVAVVAAVLTDVQAGRSIWSKEYERSTDDPIVIRDIVARDVAVVVRPAISPRPLAVTRGGTADPEAYQLYLKGRYFWNKRTSIDNQTAVGYYQRALEKDPAFALAWVALATCYSRFQWIPDKSREEKNSVVVATAAKALEIDSELGEAYAVTALSQAWYAWDMRSAAENYRRAVELSPHDSTARHWYAEFLAMHGRFDESFREYDAALTLDPLSFAILTDRSLAMIYAREYDRAIEELKRIERMNPDYQRTYYNLWIAYELKGMFEEGLKYRDLHFMLQHENGQISAESLEKYKQLSQQSLVALKNSDIKGYWRSRLDYEVFDKGIGSYITSPLGLARVYLALDDIDSAFNYLERSIELGETGLVWFKSSPEWDKLRNDPRYDDIVKRIGF